jgi:hypothetical protein
MTDIREKADQLRSGVRFMSVITIMALAGMVMRPDYRAKDAPPPRDPMKLIASPNDPYMVESIRIARMPRAKSNPWGLEKPLNGHTATFQTPGGTITLTKGEIADANTIYPQLRGHQKSPYSSSTHGSDHYPPSDWDWDREPGSE